MKVVYVICEGPTEEMFVKELLKPHFHPQMIFLKPIQMGGIRNYASFRDAIIRQHKKAQGNWVTTMVDLYGMSDKFPGYSEAQALQPIAKAERVEVAIKADVEKIVGAGIRFVPYVQLHEFEALLFSDVDIMEKALQLNQPFAAGTFASIRRSFDSPEHINDSPQTAPSKRIIGVMRSSYQKNLDGILIALEIGLDKMRAECLHFNRWIEQLEAIGTQY